ncbi:MAG: hypothetical protein VYE27_08945 [Pseudomonadota bacterium]|nr:hypothetical protein [Pseudomonadota bacterium]
MMNKKTITFEIPRYRYFAFTCSVGLLGLILIINSFSLDKAANLFFFCIGLTIILISYRIYQNRDKGFIITPCGIFEKNGRLICNFNEIDKIDTSPFSFKATNGFVVKLKNKTTFDFSVGLWWKYNRRLSIGGMISKNESKYLSIVFQEKLNDFLKKQSIR